MSRTPDTVPTLVRNGIDTTYSLLNKAKYADVYQLTMYPMAHIDFITRRIRQGAESDFGEYLKAEVARAQGWVVRYALEYLNAHLKQDSSGLAFIKNTPAKNGVPAHTMMAEFRQADQLPPSRESFAADLAGRGFEHAVERYQEARKRSANFKLTEAELKSWGYGLLGKNMRKEAIEIFKLWTVLYPDNWDAFDSLGDAYEENKLTDLAVKSFQ